MMSQCYVPQQDDDVHRAATSVWGAAAAARDSCKRVARMGLQVPIHVPMPPFPSADHTCNCEKGT